MGTKGILRLCTVMFLVHTSLFLAAFQGSMVWGQSTYPSKPVQVIVPLPAGGQSDMVHRVLAEFLKKKFGQPVVVVNAVGGSGAIGANAVTKADPDGYTVGSIGENVYMARLLLKDHPFRLSEVRAVVNFYLNENVLLVAPDSPWKTAKDLIGDAKNNPKLKFGHIGEGSSTWWRGMFLCREAGINIEGVPFEGDPGVMAAVLGKHVPMGIMSYVGSKAMYKAGKLRILMTFGPEKIQGDPSIPTPAEVLGRDVKIYQNLGPLFAPVKTPDNCVQALSNAVKEATLDPAFRSKMDEMNIIIKYMNAEEINSQIKYMTDLFIKLLESVKK
jgi:tripartite-type tricarboxylate transporter receptor subunit TctC